MHAAGRAWAGAGMTAALELAWHLAGPAWAFGMLAAALSWWLPYAVMPPARTAMEKAAAVERRVNGLVPVISAAQAATAAVDTRVTNLSGRTTDQAGLPDGGINGSSATSGLSNGTINGTSGGASAGTAHTHGAGSYAVASGQHSHGSGSYAVGNGNHSHGLPSVLRGTPHHRQGGKGWAVARRDTVPLRDYIDRAVTDLTRYHDATVSSIQSELDRRLGEVQRETESRFREQAAAVLAANAALDHRLDGMNEFRESIREVTSRKIDTDLFTETIDALRARVERAESALERQRGRMGAYAAVGTIAVIIIAIMTLVINHIRL
jgi:hypothetical protein